MVKTEAEFAEQIMVDLIEVSQIRPAVEAMLAEVKRVAVSESEYASYEDVFDRVEE